MKKHQSHSHALRHTVSNDRNLQIYVNMKLSKCTTKPSSKISKISKSILLKCCIEAERVSDKYKEKKNLYLQFCLPICLHYNLIGFLVINKSYCLECH